MKNMKFNLSNAVVITLLTSAIMFAGVACSEDEDPVINYPVETVDIVATAMASNPEQFNTLVEAVVAADLVTTLEGDGPFTVFAPTDAAFAKLGVDLSTLSKNELRDILLYHVVSGSVLSTDLNNGFVETAGGFSIQINVDNGARINTARVIQPDIMATNGVIHVIDEVLLPPSEDIVDKAISFNPDEFNTLVAAVVQADLVSTLKSAGPFTVFAPTDAAFAELGVDLASLSKEDLTSILLYHVVPASVFSTNLSEGSVQTANGASVNISLDEGVRVNESNVVIADVMTTNGVIHVIDKVLLP
jgi:transforming growth factor-beta-induced protein